MIIEFSCSPDDYPGALDLISAAFEVRTVLQERTDDARRVTMEVHPRPAEITPVVAAHVLAHFGEGGYEAGSYTRDLILLIARADPRNRRRLALAHPDYAAAVALAQDAPDGVRRLQAIAARETAVAR